MNDTSNLPFKESYDLQKLPIDNNTTDEELKEIIEQNISYFLTELGEGFLFKGRDILIGPNGNKINIDLLLYHEKHQRYLSVDVNIGEFKPEAVGRVNAELNAIEDHYETKKPPVGLILCKEADEFTVSYAIQGVEKDIAVAKYTWNELPEEYQNELPNEKEIKTYAKGKHPSDIRIFYMTSLIVFLILSWLIINVTYDNFSRLKLNYWFNIGILEVAAIPISLIIPLPNKAAMWLIGSSLAIVLTYLGLNF